LLRLRVHFGFVFELIFYEERMGNQWTVGSGRWTVVRFSNSLFLRNEWATSGLWAVDGGQWFVCVLIFFEERMFRTGDGGPGTARAG
jgi:hypothetical protein